MVIIPQDMELLPPPAQQPEHRDGSRAAAPVGFVSNTQGCSQGVF